MKRFGVGAAVAVAAALAAGCSPKVNTEVTEGSALGFSLEFFKTAVGAAGAEENVVLSPYSAGTALAMLAEGAEGQTLTEIQTALHGIDFSSMEFAQDTAVDIRSANSVWVSDRFSLKTGYERKLEENYGAEARSLDFSSPSTIAAINNWCSAQTAGKIDRIIETIDADMTMFLLNALYFKAPWTKAFDKTSTTDNVFHGTSGDQTVKMMFVKDRFEYAEYAGNQLIRLPYGNGDYSMLVLLPSKDTDADQLLPVLGEENYKAAMEAMKVKQVALKLPRFKIEVETILNGVLGELGVKRAFMRNAELGGIMDGPIAVDQVKQKCYIDVNEEGAEAAAVTSIGVRLTSVAPEEMMTWMVVDRPFYFAITGAEDNAILFAGKITNIR